MEQESKAPLWPFWIYGLIIGGAGIIFTLLFYLSGIVIKTWSGYVTLLVMFGALIGMLIMYRSEHLGGYAYYKQFIGISLLSVVLASIITALFWFMLISVFDETILEQQKVEAMEKTVKTMEKMQRFLGDIPDEDLEEIIDEALEKTENSKMLNVAWINALLSFVTNLFTLVALSFLAPVFARRKRPEGGPLTNEMV